MPFEYRYSRAVQDQARGDKRESFFEQEGNTELIAPGFLAHLRKGVRALESRKNLLAMDPIERIESAASALEILRTYEYYLRRTQYEKDLPTELSKLSPYIVSPTNSQEQANQAFFEEVYAKRRLGFLGKDSKKEGYEGIDKEELNLLREAYLDAQASFAQEEDYKIKAGEFLEIDGISITGSRAAYRKIVENAQREIESRETPEQIRQFPEEIQPYIVSNILAIELCKGCSVGCAFCAFSTEKGATDHLPFRDVVWLRNRKSNRRTQVLYYRSDPFDYHDTSEGKERDYSDLMRVFALDSPFTSTAYPKKSRSLFQEVPWALSRVSVSLSNKKRLVRDGLFTITEKQSVIPKDSDLKRALLIGVGHEKIFNFLAKDQLYPAGRQRSHDKHQDDDFVASSIACIDGVVYAPGEVRNTVRMLSSKKYKEGMVDATLTPEGLKNGEQTLKEFQHLMDKGETVSIEQVLSCGVVQSKAHLDSYDVKTRSSKEGATLESKLKDEEIVKREESFCLHVLSSQSGEKKSAHRVRTWVIDYDLVNGRVLRIKNS